MHFKYSQMQNYRGRQAQCYIYYMGMDLLSITNHSSSDPSGSTSQLRISVS